MSDIKEGFRPFNDFKDLEISVSMNKVKLHFQLPIEFEDHIESNHLSSLDALRVHFIYL